MDTHSVPRDPAWRHGSRIAAAGRDRATAARRAGASAMGVRGQVIRARASLAPRCRSLPRLAFTPA